MIGLMVQRPAGPSELSERLLKEQALLAKTEALQELQKSDCITVTVDGWSSIRMESIYGFMAMLPDRRSHMLNADDLSAKSHTGKFVAGMCNPAMRQSTMRLACFCLRLFTSDCLRGESEVTLYAAGKITDNIKKIGPLCVAALVTDNTADCKLARELVIKEKGSEHIIILR